MAISTIDDNKIETAEGKTILEAAMGAGIYIPNICAHPDLPSFDKIESIETIYRGGEPIKTQNSKLKTQNWKGCRLCVVKIEGANELQTSCNTVVTDGMVVHTNIPEVQKVRRTALAKILTTHPHSCITCAQKEGCSITQCSTNVPENERCCPKFGTCELQKVAEYIGVPADTLKYTYKDLPVIKDESLFKRDFNLCIGCLRCVRMCKDIRGVEALGFVHSDNGKPVVGTIAPSFKESGCKFCGGCAEVCPTGAIMDKDIKGEREAFLLPCVHDCPIGIDVPLYIHYIAEHKFSEALAVIREKTPFPGILGHICEHPCEADCRRGDLNEPISICALKRFVSENVGVYCNTPLQLKPSTGKNVAIVGAGPAGLTSAYYLSKLGHSVTIFESLPEPGGMMLTAIPRYRLPMEILKKEIREVIKDRIEFKNNTTIGKDITLDDLITLRQAKRDGEGSSPKGYDAIFLAIGAGLSKKISIDGIEADGVLWGLDFLKSINLAWTPSSVRSPDDSVGVPNRDPPTPTLLRKENNSKVVVIGGGNVAIDASLSCLRLGAKEVQLFCLEKQDEMPAHEWEINQAIEEGVMINCSWGPKRILQNNGKVTGVEFMKCTSVFDVEGRFNPTFDETETTSISTDLVIMAIGQSADLSILTNKIKVGDQGTIKVDSERLETTQSRIFAGGDVVSGPGSVVKAIEHGRKAAISIDRYLGGDGNIVGVPHINYVRDNTPLLKKTPVLGKEEGFADKPRIKMPCLEINKRAETFEQVELGLDEPQAIEEAKRCLRCDLRLEIHPVVLPPSAWIEFNTENINNVPDTEGVFQLLNEEKAIIYIKGTQNLKQELEGELGTKEEAKYFMYEEEPMFTKRESELIQRFLQAHSKMPKYNEEIEDLF